MKKWFFIILIGIALLVLIFDPATGWKIRHFFAVSTPNQSGSALIIENTALKSELAKLKNLSELAKSDNSSIPAIVYSSYPFGFKKEILVGAGENEGVVPGAAVVISGSGDSLKAEILLGKVESVYETTSLVETIFDARFQIPVRVGNSGVDALLVGGNDPTLTLIPKNSSINENSAVYSSGTQLPYGLAIGQIKNIHSSPDNLFMETDLTIPYDLNSVRVVRILKNK